MVRSLVIWIQFLDLKFKTDERTVPDDVTATIWYADPHLGLETSVLTRAIAR